MIKLNRLRQLRLEKGLLQSDIAKIISKSERTVGFYETGERDMGTETLAILSDFFNVSIDYLLRPESDENGEKDNVLNKEILRLLEKFSTDDKEKFVKVLRILSK